MTEKLLYITQGVEAFGHPSACTEPAPGTVESTGFASVTLNGNPLAGGGSDTMEFSSHGHDTDSDGNCIDNASHSITTDSSSSVTVNGSPVGIIGSNVDPKTGGRIEADESSLTES